jgi:hypothetical protein
VVPLLASDVLLDAGAESVLAYDVLGGSGAEDLVTSGFAEAGVLVTVESAVEDDMVRVNARRPKDDMLV